MELSEIIAGIDNQNQIRIEIELQGLYKKTVYGAVVDTGFSGSLVIPLATAVDIGLSRGGTASITLANGDTQVMPIFLCKVRIGDKVIDADTIVMGTDVLIGMGLLTDFNVCFDPGTGKVALNPGKSARHIAIETKAEPAIAQLAESLRTLTQRIR